MGTSLSPSRVFTSLAVPLCLPLLAFAQGPGGDQLESADSKGPGSPEQALRSFSVTPGLQADLWAAEPLLANPVALSFDEKGRCFVAETYRRRTSTPDIRKNMEWLIPDLALRTVADRISFLQEMLPENGTRKIDREHADNNKDGRFDWHDWAVESERVKLLEDRQGSGKADSASVYADGFHNLETGVGAGVLARDGKVWYACIPDLWRLEGDGTPAGQRESLAAGFGVHVAYGGHDMHGVKMGPDGRIYWSIADCGAHVVTKEGVVIDVPDRGAVFRINPDGSGMELFAQGLRNPQSLAFNDVGDLFTGDNNADGGDKARWLHLVEGGDYGWRIGWQFLPKLGAWNSERLWDLDAGNTAAYLLPPVGHVGHGPAGIAYYPGTGLSAAYREHFFYADFPGGVRSFAIERKGASYTLDNPKDVLLDNSPKQMTGKVVWGLYPSDVGFNTNGGLYVLDWVYGWEKTGKGRIFRLHDPAVDGSPAVLETKRILAEGMAGRSNADLVRLLFHVDQRVRLNAQFALAEKGSPAVPLLAQLAESTSLPGAAATRQSLLARLHAIWALGQIGHGAPAALAPLGSLLHDEDSEVRAQSAKVLGEFKRKEDAPAFVAMLRDSEPRARFYAALALSKSGYPAAAQPLLDLLRENGNRDAFLRHAASMALAVCAGPEILSAAAKDPSEPVRLGALLALRRLQSPAVHSLLQDKAAKNVLEAARAIHDAPIGAAFPELAALAPSKDFPAPVSRRIVNANYVLGTSETAHRLAALAANSSAAESVRLDALEALGQWNTVLGRDRVLGLWRPLPANREPQSASAASAEVIPDLLKSGSNPIRLAAAETAANLKLAAAESSLLEAALDPQTPGNIRAEALVALDSFHSPKLADTVTTVLRDKDESVLKAARKLSAKLSPKDAAAQAAAILAAGSAGEKQSVLQTLASLPPGEADRVIASQLDLLVSGRVAPAIQLDLLEAAAKRTDPVVKQKLAAYDVTRKPTDPLARWRECLEGGDPKIGREIFAEKAEAACMRCHKIKGLGGDVGPDLGQISSQHDREYILTSIVLPNAAIAPGFESVLLTLKNGNFVAGLLAAEDAAEITVSPIGGGARTKVKKTDVAERTSAPSPMPEGLGDILGKRDLRNVVEYLAGMK